MTNFRPLQPAPMEEEQPSQLPSRPQLAQKPKRTVTLGACVACRKRKSKCDGARPTCTCCAQKDTECLYELGPNEKPSQAMKRKNEEMQGELSNLRQLYDLLRLRPEQEALEILKRIRTKPPETSSSQLIQELADLVRNGDMLIKPSNASPTQPRTDLVTLPSLRAALGADPTSFSSGLPCPSGFLSMGFQGPATQRLRYTPEVDLSSRSESHLSLPLPTSIEAILYEPPLASIPGPVDPRLSFVTNWTDVANDTSLLVHLLSAWYRWEYKYFHFLDWDAFLQDMAGNQTNFCSKLLVNAMLASASFQSGMIKERSKPFADNIITLFYKEARRLWELEEGQESLPKLQAALLLYVVLGKNGRDKVGHMFLDQACRAARNLGLFRLSPSKSMLKPRGASEEAWERSRAATAWALFNFQLQMSFTYSFPVILKTQPPFPVPYDGAPDSEALFQSECARQVIILDCLSTVWDLETTNSGIAPRPEQVEVMYIRLKGWWDSRLQSLSPTQNPSPENLLAAMMHHVYNLRLVEPFLSYDNPPERVKSYRDRALSISRTSMNELRALLKLQEDRHGWSSAIPFVLHPIMVASFGSLDELVGDKTIQVQLEVNDAYQGLLTCFRALSSLSSFIFYAQPLFRVLTQTCQKLGIRLPSEVQNTLEHYRSEQWTKNAATMVSSQYVADLRNAVMDIDNGRMDSVIAQWEALTVDSKNSRTSTD